MQTYYFKLLNMCNFEHKVEYHIFGNFMCRFNIFYIIMLIYFFQKYLKEFK
jgi:hypothetical protein